MGESGPAMVALGVAKFLDQFGPAKSVGRLLAGDLCALKQRAAGVAPIR